MQNKIVIAIVAILMAASFAGIVCVGDDSDAAVTSPITISTAEGEYIAGNSITIADGKVSGTLKESSEASDSYKFTLIINGLSENQNVYYTYKDSAGVIKSEQGTSADAGKAKIVFEGTASNIKGMATDFKFIVTSADINAGSGGVALFTEMFATIGQTLQFDLQFSGEIINITYIVGSFVSVKTAMKEQPYVLLSPEELNAPAQAGVKFAGWNYKIGELEYQPLAGSSVSFSGSITLTAVFEDITPVVTFAVNGVVVPELTKTINYGEKIVAPEVPEGCTGWNFDFTKAIFADVQIDAILEEVPEVQVTFFDGITYYGPVKVSEIKDKIPTVTKDGHDFVGWFIDGVKVDPLAYEFTEDTTLVAGWDPIKCKVVFMVGGAIYKEQTVEYGKTATEAVLPEGYSAWDFKFDTPITEDLTVITAIEKAPEKPTGLADPTVKMALVIVGLFVCVLLAVIILKREDIRAGMVRKLSKAEDVKEDKKE